MTTPVDALGRLRVPDEINASDGFPRCFFHIGRLRLSAKTIRISCQRNEQRRFRTIATSPAVQYERKLFPRRRCRSIRTRRSDAGRSVFTTKINFYVLKTTERIISINRLFYSEQLRCTRQFAVGSASSRRTDVRDKSPFARVCISFVNRISWRCHTHSSRKLSR